MTLLKFVVAAAAAAAPKDACAFVVTAAAAARAVATVAAAAAVAVAVPFNCAMGTVVAATMLAFLFATLCLLLLLQFLPCCASLRRARDFYNNIKVSVHVCV